MPSRLHARRQMLKVLYGVTEVPAAAAGKKKNTKSIDLVAKIFDDVAPKYVGRNGGYTRICLLYTSNLCFFHHVLPGGDFSVLYD